jgi:uncharacterized protein (DUF1697 family)
VTAYVALLRAIGPVTHRVMRPAALRDKAEEAGLDRPVNYLATGNLIFSSTKSPAVLRREITALVEGFGLTSSEVFIASRRQIEAIIEADPFDDASRSRPARIGVCIFHKALDWPEALLKPDGPEKVAAAGRALIIDYGPGGAPSRLNVEKLAGARMTQRNWNTILGVADRLRDR